MFLGIDLGSSFIKSAVINNSEIIFSLQIPSPPFIYSVSGKKEIDVVSFALAVRDIIEKISDSYPIDAIYFTSQMHGLILFAENGRALTPFISWQDRRAFEKGPDGISAYDYITDTAGEFIGACGEELTYSHTVCQLMAIRRSGLRCCASLSLLDGAIIRFLCGATPSIHPTMAASTGLYDINTGTWNFKLMKALSLLNISLPAIARDNEACTVYKFNGREIPVYPAVGDHQASFLGSVSGENDLLINVGTGAQVSILCPSFLPSAAGTRPYFGSKYIRTITHLPGGAALSDMADRIGRLISDVTGTQTDSNKVWDAVDRLISPDIETPLSVSFGFSSGCGVISGIGGSGSDLASLFFAAYSEMAKRYHSAAELLAIPYNSVVCAGGAIVKSNTFADLISKEFGISCRIVSGADSCLVGLSKYVNL